MSKPKCAEFKCKVEGKYVVLNLDAGAEYKAEEKVRNRPLLLRLRCFMKKRKMFRAYRKFCKFAVEIND